MSTRAPTWPSEGSNTPIDKIASTNAPISTLATPISGCSAQPGGADRIRRPHALEFVGLRNALNDFRNGVVQLERARIDPVIRREAVEKTIQIVADSCCEWYARIRRKQLRKPHHVVRVFADALRVHGFAF